MIKEFEWKSYVQEDVFRYYQIHSEKLDLFYTAVTKCGSTSIIKKLLELEYNIDTNDQNEIHEKSFMMLVKNWKKAETCKNKIIIFRDPVQRLISGFNDIIIKRADSSKILKIIRKDFGLKVVTFRDFVKYLSITPDFMLDPHFRPQVNFIARVEYSSIIDFKNINSEFRQIGVVIEELNKSFKKAQSSDIINFQLMDEPVETLNKLYNNIYTYTYENLIDEEIANTISKRYEEDINIIKKYV